MTVNKKINLLIREINVITRQGKSDKNARLIRENLRRIKAYLDDIIVGDITVGAASNSATSDYADVAEFMSYEEQICTSDNQTAFTLANTPSDASKVRMLVNSCELSNGRHFSVVGKDVTFYPLVAEFELEINNELGLPDIILFQYVKA